MQNYSPKKNPLPLLRIRGSKAVSLLLLVSYAVLQLPSFAWLIGILLLITVVAMTLSRRTKHYYFFLLILLCMVSARFYSYQAIRASVAQVPPVAISPAQMLQKRPYLLLLGFSDLYIMEHEVRRKYLTILKEKGEGLDPFTGRPYLAENETVYSIGPDLQDNNMSIEYDPTNGTYSKGDIAISVSTP